MSARRPGSSADNLDLSLTGSQFSSLSGSKKQPSSAKPGKRPNSASGLRPSGSQSVSNGYHGSSDSSTRGTVKKKHARAGSHNGNLSSRSDVSTTSTVKASSRGAKPTPRDDFLSLFESSTQPKIIQSNKTKKSSSTSKLNKGLWHDESLKTNVLPNSSLQSPSNLYSPMFDGTRPKSYVTYTPSSARSVSTVDSEAEFQNTNNDFVKKSNENDNYFTNLEKRTNGQEATYSSPSNRRSNDLERPLSSFRKSNDLIPSIANSLRDSGELSPSPRKVPNESSMTMNSIANNMKSQGQSRSMKTSVSSIENIKHKMPVNQVKETQGSVSNSVVGRNVAEDYIKTVNMAATRIQRFYRKYLRRKKTSEAAMRRMLSQKREDMQNLAKSGGGDTARRTEEERKRAREEKARAARQHAIKELQQKREEKRLENQRIAEEEISFLQASGKISKAPAKGKKKVLTKTRPKSKMAVDSESDMDPMPSSRPTTASSVGRKVDDIFQNTTPRNNSARVDDDSTTDITLDTERSDKSEDDQGLSASNAGTKTTLEDLMNTIKLLEQEDKFPTPRNELKKSWGEEDDDNDGYLSSDKLEKLNNPRKVLGKSANLSDAKLKSIMSFLDEVDSAERLSEIDQELTKANHLLEKPALLVPSADQLAQLEQASAQTAEVTNTVLAQRLELEERNRTVQILQKALNQQRELTVRHAKETEREMKKRLDIQKQEYEETIKRHLSFIDQLIDDKKALSEKCENMVKELKTLDKKFSDKFKQSEDNHNIEMSKIKETHAAAEKLRRERWIDEKTKKIKEMTVKGLEPEIQRLIAKHKNEMKKVKSIHEAELLRSDERAGQRYIEMTEQLRDQLAKEKELACQRERELAASRYEKQMQQEEEAYQAQRRRLHQEVQEEKDRLAQQATRQRAEIDKLQRQLEDSHTHSVDSLKDEYEKAREEQERRHTAEMRSLREQLDIEKRAWEENYMKKQEAWMLQKERELKEQVRKDRDKEIEMVISRLESDTISSKEECERAAENRIKRIRDKYESEMTELERSERQAMEKYNEMKAELLEIEGENSRFKVLIKQKDQEVLDVKKLSEKLHNERDHVAEIVRQEFADKLVATDEDNKRLKLEMAEQKSRHRLEIERSKAEIEVIQKSKEEEMEEVHKRVKQAIVKKEEMVNQMRQQYQSALKRSEHLEGLLEQQRKQILGKKK